MTTPTLGNLLKILNWQQHLGLHFRLSDFTDKANIVLYFYPKDSTPGCTTEGQDFRDAYAQFQAADTAIFGISRDSLKSHENFKAKQAFPFELLADQEETVCKLFDVIKLKNMYGKQVLGIERSTFLLDKQGVLRHEWRKVSVKGHVAAVLAAAQALALINITTKGKRMSPVHAPHTHEKRLFVLDTNVLMHDPTALFRFQEHDVFLPMVVLEELDHSKKGVSEVARNVRQVSRFMDDLLSDVSADSIHEGVSLAGDFLKMSGKGGVSGKLFFQTEALPHQLPANLPGDSPDNTILSVALSLRDKYPDRDVILVSKDINLRIKATIVGLKAEDYFNDQVLDDVDLLADRLP